MDRAILRLLFVSNYWKAPHGVDASPAGVACTPRDAGVKDIRTRVSPTDDQPPPRQQGEAVVFPWSRQVRDGAGVRGRAREQFHAREDVASIITTTHHHLPWKRSSFLT